MAQGNHAQWQDWAEAFAFLGNSLLGTMRATSDVGLDVRFWQGFPTFGSDEAVAACQKMGVCASALAKGDDPVTTVSVEYTHLFVGPPQPAAAPWETFYRDGGAKVGFGQPTFEMRELLRHAGLALSNENNQYEDHMGIELLLLSALCTRMVQGPASEDAPVAPDEVRGFLEAHPLSWIADFRAAVAQAAPEGYYDCLLGVAETLLGSLRSQLSSQ